MKPFNADALHGSETRNYESRSEEEQVNRRNLASLTQLRGRDAAYGKRGTESDETDTSIEGPAVVDDLVAQRDLDNKCYEDRS